jgi:hypothetical protein
MRKENTGQPTEEPDPSSDAMQIELNPIQFHWITQQYEFLGVTKQELIADALEEWVCRNRSIPLHRINASAIVYWALDDFMRRHRNEFLPVSGKN